jgi:hypothetical protein
MTAALGPCMMRHPEVKNSVEAIVMQCVTPEFRAQEGYLRAIVSFFFFSGSVSGGGDYFTDVRFPFFYRHVKLWAL